MIEAAGGGDPDALVGLQQTAHRLVGRAGATQFLGVAQLAAALETLATPEPGASFDERRGQPAARRDLERLHRGTDDGRVEGAGRPRSRLRRARRS